MRCVADGVECPVMKGEFRRVGDVHAGGDELIVGSASVVQAEAGFQNLGSPDVRVQGLFAEDHVVVVLADVQDLLALHPLRHPRGYVRDAEKRDDSTEDHGRVRLGLKRAPDHFGDVRLAVPGLLVPADHLVLNVLRTGGQPLLPRDRVRHSPACLHEGGPIDVQPVQIASVQHLRHLSVQLSRPVPTAAAPYRAGVHGGEAGASWYVRPLVLTGRMRCGLRGDVCAGDWCHVPDRIVPVRLGAYESSGVP